MSTTAGRFHWWNDEVGWLRLQRCPVGRIALTGCWGDVDVDYCWQVPLVERWSRLVAAAQVSGWPDCTSWLLWWCGCRLLLAGSTGGTLKSASWGCTGVRLDGLN